MNWNYALMNPPYDKTLHLKFLEKVIDICDKVVSIEPAEWLAKPYMKDSWQKLKEKYENTIGQHFDDLEILDHNPFDAGIDLLLGIYTLSTNGDVNKYNNFSNTFDTYYLDNLKRFKTKYSLKDKATNYKQGMKYFVPIRTDGNCDRWWTLQLINYLDIIVDGKVYSGDYKGLTIPEARRKNPRENPRNSERNTFGIEFNSLEEAINFRDSVKLEAYLFIIISLKTMRGNPLNKLPYLDNYKEKWTNDKIFDLFNIDKKYRNDIIELLQPFTHYTKKFGSTFFETRPKLEELLTKK